MASKAASAKPRQSRKKAATTDLAVGMVIDKSSSMMGLTSAVIAGFNEYVGELREQEGETFMTLCTFSDAYEFVYEGKPLADVADLGSETYRPYGNTALYDSIAATVQRVEAKLKAEGREGTKVLIVTITDGQENKSQEHTAASLAALVREYEAKGNYTFVYLGLGQQKEYVASAAVRGMGYVGDNGYYPAATPVAMASSMSGLAHATNVHRHSSKGTTANLMADAGLDVNSDAQPAPEPGAVPGSAYTKSSLLDHLGGR
jgi:uncharacterized protein YegL